jgi:HEAT repeat protein
MTQVSNPSPELTQAVTALARALLAGARNWAMYPPEHPTAKASMDRLLQAVEQATANAVLSIGVTPDTLLVDGLPLAAREGPVVDAAALLHNRDILRLTFVGAASAPALRSLLSVLSLDQATLRERGGPAGIWAREGHHTIAIEQIDYRKVLEDREAPREARTDDDLWRHIVRSISVHGMTEAFDDAKVAELLASALAADGKATERLAQIFNTIAPDEERKRRVLSLARSYLSETDFGRSEQFQALWTSMEELLISYNEGPYVSDSYRAALDGVSGRAQSMGVAQTLPPEMPEWSRSLGQENVRRLSVVLLIDLLSLEKEEARAAEIAGDMEALAEDLLLSGDYADAVLIVRSLAEAASDASRVGHAAGADARRAIAESHAWREVVALFEDLDAEAFDPMCACALGLGAAAVPALSAALRVEGETRGRRRAGDIIVAYGEPAVAPLAPLLDDPRWFVQASAIDLLGRIASPQAVAPLQGVLRRGDPRVCRHAVAALASIEDPAAARAIHTVLRTAAGELREAVVEALIAVRLPRIVPMLLQILRESDPLGRDHTVALDALAALAGIADDRAVPAVAAVMARWRWYRRGRMRVLKQRAAQVLVKIGSPAARDRLRHAAERGDRMLRKIARQAVREPAT